MLYLSGTVITALKPGTATVTATLKSDETVKETATVTVTADAASKPAVRITGENIVAVGDTAMYSATLLRAPAGEYSIEYEVSNTTVADIDGDGILTTKAIGPVRITATATYRTVKFEEEFEVEVKPLSVAFKEESISMNEWESKRIEVDTFGSAATLSVSDTTVLYLSGNTVTAIGAGTATITATLDKDETITDTLDVTVSPSDTNKPVLAITEDEVQDNNWLIAVDDKAEFAAALSHAAPGEYNVVFASEHASSDIAEITSAGAFTAKKAGTITVKASTTYRSVKFTTSREVTVVGVTDVTFLKKEEGRKMLDVGEAFGVPKVEQNTNVQIGGTSGKTYTADGNGCITLDTADIGSAGNAMYAKNGAIKTVKIGNSADTYYVRTYISTTDGSAFSDKPGFAASSGKYTVNAQTAFTDEFGLPWITFDASKAKLQNKYKYLRVKVKFNAFADEMLTASEVVSAHQCNGDEMWGYSFGYKYGNTYVYFDRTYNNDTVMFGGTVNLSTGWAYDSGKPVLNIYDGEGNRLMQWENTQWSPYISPLETGKEYIFEFPVESTGDITANFGFDAEVSEIVWSIWDLHAEEQAAGADTVAGEIYAGETKLDAQDDGSYTLTAPSDEIYWVNFGNDATKLREYKYLRVTVKISEFMNVTPNGTNGLPTYESGNYAFDFGFMYQDRLFVSYTATAGWGFHGYLESGYGAGYIGFVIYANDGSKVAYWNGDAPDYPWTGAAMQISANTEYIFEFPVYETGAITANFGKSATVKNVTWSKKSLAEELADAALGSPATTDGKVYAGGTPLEKTGEGYAINSTSVTPDTHGISWVTFDDAAAKQALGYNYLRVTVNIAQFNGKKVSDIGVPAASSFGNYNFNYGFTYGECFVICDAQWGFHGYMESGDGAGTTEFNIYQDGTTVRKPYDAPWLEFDTVSVNTDYIFEFPIYETGDITANFGASATIKEITWAKTSLGAAA